MPLQVEIINIIICCNIKAARLGILDNAPTHKPNFHIFVASKAPWFDINDDLKQFNKGPVA
jgi:hypothetical protein